MNDFVRKLSRESLRIVDEHEQHIVKIRDETYEGKPGVGQDEDYHDYVVMESDSEDDFQQNNDYALVPDDNGKPSEILSNNGIRVNTRLILTGITKTTT